MCDVGLLASGRSLKYTSKETTPTLSSLAQCRSPKLSTLRNAPSTSKGPRMANAPALEQARGAIMMKAIMASTPRIGTNECTR
ncbi:hypothetical protein ASPSYDRAFT_389181 [Aspergillus sydowii CBS 593.65]|uniref:Uncharacterized protein n=1 Tax=Aspergillus sydowii CBS 593.65 TaxID=1036612 RepID=A0A1L9T8Y2_9EURO|nr:uncharacterized protein ASPSYDRAFT_389181 [Aspergillus sydowii CBS 593.65]OJJ55887.1 hypothetical protein ASPSYDRAFT_389181 [Aspergillus sydowii CBS 593.65]